MQPSIIWFRCVFIVFRSQKMNLQNICSHTAMGAILEGCNDTLYLECSSYTYMKEINKVMESKNAHGYIELVFP